MQEANPVTVEQSDRPIMHIGYHRTGSTFLQAQVFYQHPCIISPGRLQIQKHLLRAGGLQFDRETATTWLENLRTEARQKSKRVVISDEELSGNIHTGGGGGFVTKEAAHRLREIAPDAFIVVVIRNQLDMINSSYAEYVKHGGALPFKCYLSDRGHNHRAPGFRFAHLYYHHLIQLYMELFSPSQVKVLTYESLCHDPEGFVNDILNAIGLRMQPKINNGPENPSLPPSILAFKRHTNRFTDENRLNRRVIADIPHWDRASRKLYKAASRYQILRNLPPISLRLTARQREAICDLYRAGNRRVEELTGIDLRKHGYPL